MFEKFKSIPTHMDFEGQKLAERIFQIIILTSAIIGFAVGNYNQRFSFTVYILGIGFVLCCLITLPPWSMYRKTPLNWQKPVIDDHAESSPSNAPQKSKKKK